MGNIAAVAHCAQLVYDGLPQVGCLGGFYCGNTVRCILNGWRSFGLALFRFSCGLLLCLYRGREVYGRTFSLLGKLYLTGRQTVLTATGVVFQIAVNVVLRLGETYLLCEDGLVLEESECAVEDGVVLLLQVAACLQLAHQFGPFQLDSREGGIDGQLLAGVGRIDVPPFVDGGREHDLGCCLVKLLELRAEMHGVHYLRMTGYHRHIEQQ